MEVPDPVKPPAAREAPQEATLFDTEQDHRNVRRSDPQTSADAVPMPTERAKALREVLDAYRKHGAMTAYECGNVLQKDGVWKRVSDLKRDGWLVMVGTRMNPKTGKQNAVFMLNPERK